ncbi:HTH-type transcriptional repressor RspR [Lentibacillus sp. JNUCC-1]|uniref:GntR family transcriptional regulator n=1 Tax=Lentibacillus sp. JNUCC-1 TaxID=2654513 RepID=UPI0012E7E02F|nr:GntR family transcriptional regulator [Lentibacillus sp. JNUCC-1]MUV38991.1 HTH-type transcriptional repressor RspR [Lentibacillus sp. JNUCC-1]
MKKENKQQKAYRMIKARIIERIYAPGQRIVIDQHAKEFETSQIPVREALRQLEAEELIVYKPNIGPVVAEVNESDYSDALRTLSVLEGYATALAAGQLSQETIGYLKEKHIHMKEALEDFDILRYATLNSDFHQLITDACGNPYLIRLIRDTWQRLDSIRGPGSMMYSGRVKESVAEHQQLINMLETNASPNEIEQLARHHKLRTAENFEKRRMKDDQITTDELSPLE